jgi:hypothetical protein
MRLVVMVMVYMVVMLMAVVVMVMCVHSFHMGSPTSSCLPVTMTGKRARHR